MVAIQLQNSLSSALFFYLEGNDLFSRMLYIENGQLKEDAATGSASTCLQAYLLKYHTANLQITNQQGDAIGRPSKIYFNGQWDGVNFDIKIGGILNTSLKEPGKYKLINSY